MAGAAVVWIVGIYALGILVNAPVLWGVWTLGGAAVWGIWLEHRRARGAAQAGFTERPPRG